MRHVMLFEDWGYYDNNAIIEFDIPAEQWFTEQLNKLGIGFEILEPIAEGGYGYAVDLGNNTIVKVTSDLVEMKYANILKNVESPNLVKVYDVVILEGETRFDNYHLIHMEKLNTKISQNIKHMCYYLHKYNPIVNILETKGYVDDSIVLDFFKTKLVSFNDTAILFLFNKWLNVWNECKKYKLPISELHEKNIGVRDGKTEIVYFDISDQSESNPNTNDIKKYSI